MRKKETHRKIHCLGTYGTHTCMVDMGTWHYIFLLCRFSLMRLSLFLPFFISSKFVISSLAFSKFFIFSKTCLKLEKYGWMVVKNAEINVNLSWLKIIGFFATKSWREGSEWVKAPLVFVLCDACIHIQCQKKNVRHMRRLPEHTYKIYIIFKWW